MNIVYYKPDVFSISAASVFSSGTTQFHPATDMPDDHTPLRAATHVLFVGFVPTVTAWQAALANLASDPLYAPDPSLLPATCVTDGATLADQLALNINVLVTPKQGIAAAIYIFKNDILAGNPTVLGYKELGGVLLATGKVPRALRYLLRGDTTVLGTSEGQYLRALLMVSDLDPEADILSSGGVSYSVTRGRAIEAYIQDRLTTYTTPTWFKTAWSPDVAVSGADTTLGSAPKDLMPFLMPDFAGDILISMDADLTVYVKDTTRYLGWVQAQGFAYVEHDTFLEYTAPLSGVYLP